MNQWFLRETKGLLMPAGVPSRQASGAFLLQGLPQSALPCGKCARASIQFGGMVYNIYWKMQNGIGRNSIHG